MALCSKDGKGILESVEELVFVDSLYTGYHRRGEEDLKNANKFLRTCGLTPEQDKSLKNGSRDERLFMA